MVSSSCVGEGGLLSLLGTTFFILEPISMLGEKLTYVFLRVTTGGELIEREWSIKSLLGA